MLIQLILAATFAASVIWLIWIAHGTLLTKVPLGKGLTMRVVLYAEAGCADYLEHAVDTLVWLRRSGSMDISSLVVCARGIDAEGRELAKALERKYDEVLFREPLHSKEPLWQKDAQG